MAFDSDHARTHSQVGKINPSTVTEDWESTDLYAFFLRKSNPETGVAGRIMGGFTGNKDGLLGLDISAPITEKWAIEANAMYLIPEEGSATTGYSEEARLSLGVGTHPDRLHEHLFHQLRRCLS